MTTRTLQWCSTHDVEIRPIRTGDDKQACWYVWWVEAIDAQSPFADQSCEPTTKLLVDDRRTR